MIQITNNAANRLQVEVDTEPQRKAVMLLLETSLQAQAVVEKFQHQGERALGYSMLSSGTGYQLLEDVSDAATRLVNSLASRNVALSVVEWGCEPGSNTLDRIVQLINDRVMFRVLLRDGEGN